MPKVTETKVLTRDQFTLLFKTHYETLCRFAYQYVLDTNTAQDICQSVFVNLWHKRQTIDQHKSIKSYLYTAVKNRSLNHLRDHKKYRSKVLDLDSGAFDIAEDFATVDAEEIREKVQLALSELPEKCRQVFEMSRFQHMKYREIADELNISPKTVEAHMSKAMKMLRQSLKGLLTLAIMVSFSGLLAISMINWPSKTPIFPKPIRVFNHPGVVQTSSLLK